MEGDAKIKVEGKTPGLVPHNPPWLYAGSWWWFSIESVVKESFLHASACRCSLKGGAVMVLSHCSGGGMNEKRAGMAGYL